MKASQCSISASDAGRRDWRIGDGSSTMDLSSWRRRLVEGGVGEREVAMMEAIVVDPGEYWCAMYRLFFRESSAQLGLFFGSCLPQSLRVVKERALQNPSLSSIIKIPVLYCFT